MAEPRDKLTEDVACIILDFRFPNRRAITADWLVAHRLASQIIEHMADYIPDWEAPDDE